MKNSNWGKDKLIGSLAILKSRMVFGNDFISTYIPFVARVLININSEKGISIAEVVEGFGIEYGFSIDRPAMTTILNKCAKEGLIKKKKNAVYEVVLEKCDSVAINTHDVNLQYKKYNDVVDKLKKYYEEAYDISLDVHEVESMLMSFLNEHSSKTIITKFDDLKEDEHSAKQHHYIISKFIKKCQKEDEVTFQLIIDLAVSYLFTSAIAYGEGDEKTRIDGYRDLRIYLDTPFVLRVLGLNGEEMRDAAKAMLEQLYDMNCRFYVFSHTYDEITQILKDCYKWIENPQYDAFYASYALRTFVEKKFTKADVQEYIDTLENKLKYYKIQIDDTDYCAGKYYNTKVDEAEIQGKIVQIYKDGSAYFDEYSKKSTIEFDTKSLSTILKLWGNRCSRTYKQAKYVLLTTNTTLAYVTRQFDEKLNPCVANSVYPCITDVFLGTNMWLGAPINKIQDFSEKKLLADCMSIIEPSDALIRKLQDSITKAFEDETITEDQYYLLKTKAFSNDYIMQKTLGDEKYFTDTITEELLADIEKEIIQPYQSEIEYLNNSLTQEMKEKSKAISEIQTMRAAEEERRVIEQQKQAKYEEKAEKTLSGISVVVFSCIIIPIASTFINFSGLIPIPTWVVIVSAILILILPLLGVAINSKKCKLNSILKKRLIKNYKLNEYKKTL